MKPKTKWLLIGLVIGAAVGIAATLLLLRSGLLLRPGMFPRRAGNFTGNFTRPFRGGP